MFRLSKLLFDFRILRFGLVGVMNTALGYAVILAALGLGFGDFRSNAMGYAAGLVFGFALNSRWTFREVGRFKPGLLPRYIAAYLVAYAANLTVVFGARAAGMVDSPLAHLAAIVIFSILFYLGSRHFVFVAEPAGGKEQDVQGISPGNEARLF